MKKSIILVVGIVAALFLLSISAYSGQPLATSTFLSPAYECNGTPHQTAKVLDYGFPMYLRAAAIKMLAASPGQDGYVDISYNSPWVDGQAILAGIHGSELSDFISFGANALPIPAAQSLAIEWGCTGGGSRQFKATFYFSGVF